MRQVQIALAAGTFIIVLGLLQLVLLRVLNIVWWRRAWIRRTSKSILLSSFLISACWVVVVYLNQVTAIYIFATLESLVAVVSLSLIFSLPLSGTLNTSEHFFLKWRLRRDLNHNKPPESPDRRQALQRVAAVFPLAALTLGTDGLARSYSGCQIREMPFYFDDLPDALDGFRIFHVSDTHLGPYVDNDDVAALMEKAQPLKPDLMLISGDVADDLSLLDDAIRLFESLKTPYGAFASMGNHDYWRGAPQVIGAFAKSSIPMLIDKGVNLHVNGIDLFIGGADDPRRMGVPIDGFMKRTIDKTLESASSDSFKIIMTHRPCGFDRAAEQNVNLCLAGHTHGGQIGFMGKSVFTNWGGERYIWGHYKIGKSQLYTTCGVGHSFPFRLGCPTEAPIIVLRKGPNSSIA